MMRQQPIIAYRRVSTKRQEDSGLGLDAQLKAIRDFTELTGAKVLRIYTETESGRNCNRPELAKAIADAKRSNAKLVIAKLDRLSRNAAFLLTLQDSKLDFVCCDNPDANRLTIGILAVVAEDEAIRISQRTKAALAAYKARGGLLGGSRPECRNLTEDGRQRGVQAASRKRTASAAEAYTDLTPMMREWKADGYTQKAIANELNRLEYATRQGKPWNQGQVSRVLNR